MRLRMELAEPILAKFYGWRGRHEVRYLVWLERSWIQLRVIYISSPAYAFNDSSQRKPYVNALEQVHHRLSTRETFLWRFEKTIGYLCS